MFNRIRKALTARKTKRQVRPLPKQLQAPELPLVMHDNHDGTFTIAPNTEQLEARGIIFESTDEDNVFTRIDFQDNAPAPATPWALMEASNNYGRTETGEALTQFAKTLPNYPVRILEYGLSELEAKNLANITHNKFTDTVELETLLPDVSTKEIHVTTLTAHVETTLKALEQVEKELTGTKANLEQLYKSLKASKLYSEEAAKEIALNQR